MTDELSPQEKMAVQERLKWLVTHKIIKLAELQRAFERWARENNRSFASDQTLDSWMTTNFKEVENPGWNTGRVRSFLAFLRTRPDLNPNKAAALVHVLEDRFRTEFGFPHHYLKSLCGGPFAMYRPLWSQPESGLFIRSIVTFKEDQGLIFYEEKQDFLDPVRKIKRTETDGGAVMMFGYNVYILSRGRDVNTLKLLVIHESDPLVDGKKQTDFCKGNMLAVVGRGPHPGFKFVLRRIEHGEDEISRVIDKSALDAVAREYLMG